MEYRCHVKLNCKVQYPELDAESNNLVLVPLGIIDESNLDTAKQKALDLLKQIPEHSKVYNFADFYESFPFDKIEWDKDWIEDELHPDIQRRIPIVEKHIRYGKYQENDDILWDVYISLRNHKQHIELMKKIGKSQ